MVMPPSQEGLPLPTMRLRSMWIAHEHGQRDGPDRDPAAPAAARDRLPPRRDQQALLRTIDAFLKSARSG